MSKEVHRLQGHGSIYRGSAVALQHVGYWLTERDDEDVKITTGYIRGDPQVLRPMARAGDLLILVLETGQRLPFRLTHGLPDGITWEIDALGTPR